MNCSFQELIRHMLATSGKTAAQVSRELGNDSNHLSVILSSGRTPRLDLFVKIAEACGFHVGVTGWGDLESWELGTDNGKVVAFKEYGIEDMDEISQREELAHDALRNEGRNEVLDELIQQLQQMREATDQPPAESR